MKNLLFSILLLGTFLSAYANDGVYLSSGSTIYPINETKISLEKEILSFKVINEEAQVTVYFEFYNPESVTRKLKVGFQAPSPSGDVVDATSNSAPIKNFRIQNQERLVPFKLLAAECENCNLKDTSELRFSQNETGIYVYLFEVEFKPGLNIIQHSYSYPASSNVSIDQLYDYILKTGSKWSGGKIRDFKLQVDFGPNSYFFIKDIFGTNASWSIIGTGKVTQTGFTYEYFNRMVRILSGHLEISVTNFTPKANLEIGIINSDSFISHLLDSDDLPVKIYNSLIYKTTDLTHITTEPFSKEELKICRNAIYAQYGYAFRSKDLLDFFNQFGWYIPDPNLAIKQISLTPDEQTYVNEILNLENQNN